MIYVLFFAFIEKGPQLWFFKEIQYLTELQFENKDAEKIQSYASNVANWLQFYPYQDVLCADYVIAEWRPELVKRVVKYLVPDNVRVTILSKKCRFFTSLVK